ncbi:MAG: hypothetical protein KA419_20375 [Acidobacteria bacterium]|nr:hypothetical protein [Acidobacteriota bacterium]
MKHRALWTVLALAALTVVAVAQVPTFEPPKVTIPTTNNGVGARAMGMGGAFTAVADDGTAATWNPAGLSQLKRPQVTLVYNFINDDRTTRINGDYRSGANTTTYDAHETGHYDINALQFVSGTYPFLWKDRQCAVQVSYNRILQQPDGNVGRVFTFHMPSGVDEIQNRRITMAPKGGIDLWTGTFSIELVKKLHLGFSLNYLKAKYSYRSAIYEEVGTTDGTYASMYMDHVDDYFSFTGFTADLGLLWKPNDKFSAGFVYHTKFNRSIREQYTRGPGSFRATTGADYHWQITNDWHGRVTWPQSAGFGVAYRPTQNLLLASDYMWTQWREGKIVYDVPAAFGTYAFPNVWVRRQHDVHTVRLGGEYTFIMKNGWVVPVRAGYFRSNNPSNYFDSEGTNYQQTAINGFTVGGGITINYVQADIAYVRTMGQDRKSDVGQSTAASFYEIGESDYKGNQLIISLIVRF